MEDELIAFLGDDDAVIELRRFRPNWLKLIQWWKDDEDNKEVIYIRRSQVSDLIKVLQKVE